MTKEDEKQKINEFISSLSKKEKEEENLKKQKINDFISSLSKKEKEEEISNKQKINKFLKDFLEIEEQKSESKKQKVLDFLGSLSAKQKQEDQNKKEKINKFLKKAIEEEELNRIEKENKLKAEREKINVFISSLSKKEKEKEKSEKEKIDKFLQNFLIGEEEKKKQKKEKINDRIKKIHEQELEENRIKKEEKEKIKEFLKPIAEEERKKREENKNKIQNFIKSLSDNKKENEQKQKEKINIFLKNLEQKKEENLKKINNLIKTFSLKDYLSYEDLKKEKEEIVSKINDFLKRIPTGDFIRPSSPQDSYLKGTNIGAPIVPGSEIDTFPTHDEKYGLGGYRSVKNNTERDAIPLQRRKVGMIVRTMDSNIEWILLNDISTWVPNKIDTNDINNLDEYLNSKADIQDPNFYGNVNINGKLNAVYAEFNGFLNTGAILQNNSFSTGKVSIRTKILNFKNIEEIEIFKVPSGFMFLLDSIELVTTKIISPRVSPSIKFSSNGSTLFGPKNIVGNQVGDRHIIENPQSGIFEGSNVTLKIVDPSTATIHEGVGIVSGSLLKINDYELFDLPPLDTPPYTLNLCEHYIGSFLSCNKTINQLKNDLTNLGWSNIRYENNPSEVCSSCLSVNFYGTCCNTCESVNQQPAQITYSDCYGPTSVSVWRCC